MSSQKIGHKYFPSSCCWRLKRRWWLQGGVCRRRRPWPCRRTNHKWRSRSWIETKTTTRRTAVNPECHMHSRRTASGLGQSWNLKRNMKRCMNLPQHRRIASEPERVSNILQQIGKVSFRVYSSPHLPRGPPVDFVQRTQRTWAQQTRQTGGQRPPPRRIWLARS